LRPARDPLHSRGGWRHGVSHRLGWLRDHNRAVSVVTGAMLVMVGFLMITNTFARLSSLFAPLGA
jgi:cytochrome c-type biogenesis protein